MSAVELFGFGRSRASVSKSMMLQDLGLINSELAPERMDLTRLLVFIRESSAAPFASCSISPNTPNKWGSKDKDKIQHSGGLLSVGVTSFSATALLPQCCTPKP